jgi:DNA-binding response OmpR family regulator
VGSVAGRAYPLIVNTRATGGVLLLVEDDDSIGRLVKQYLEQQDSWRVVWLRSGEEAVMELRHHPVRLVVLDIGLPGIDGFEVCRRIRAGSNVPIIMLTARDDEPDRVAGLEIGADDYVAKPFSPRELSARIKAILRRSETHNADEVLSAREIVLRRDSREVTADGVPVELTGKEFDLLACFLEHPGIVLSRERLLDLVWGMTYPGGTRTVDMHVAQLRRKLGDAEGIRTVRGAGYKLIPA